MKNSMLNPAAALAFAIFLSVFASVSAALPQPDLIAHIYFAGGDKISTAPNVNAFTNQFASPPALALRRQTADKLAPWLAGWLQKNLGAFVPDGAARLRPLLDDLQSAEWTAEARAAAAGSPPEVAIAIKLDAPRTAAWQAALKPFFPAATFTTSAGWLIFDSGTGGAKLGAALARKVSAPPSAWFSADVNWPHLARWFPQLASLELPETQFTVTTQGTNFQTDGKFLYSRPLSLKLDSWQVPSNLVHQPFVSFTAVRGFAPWLAAQDWLQPYQVTPTPNQAFIWALPSIPFQTFLAEPVPDAMAALDQTYQRLQPLFVPGGFLNQGFLHPSITRTNNEITLLNMPMFDPFIRAEKGPSGQFLFAGGFPNIIHSKPLPEELYHRLATPNLVYYHWEITSQRVLPMLQFSQAAFLLTNHRQLGVNSVSLKWLKYVGSAVGYNRTEVTVAAPDQLAFTRASSGLFTSVEMYALANWLEAKNFPGCDLRLPPLSERLKHAQALMPGASAPVQPPK